MIRHAHGDRLMIWIPIALCRKEGKDTQQAQEPTGREETYPSNTHMMMMWSVLKFRL